MKTSSIFAIAILAVILFASNTNAQTVGTGNGKGVKTNWVDKNGDGLCDNVGTPAQGTGRTGKGYGKKDGTGNPVRPQDGTGNGKKGGNAATTGVHDGTGPGATGTAGGRGYRGGKK